MRVHALVRCIEIKLTVSSRYIIMHDIIIIAHGRSSTPIVRERESEKADQRQGQVSTPQHCDRYFLYLKKKVIGANARLHRRRCRPTVDSVIEPGGVVSSEILILDKYCCFSSQTPHLTSARPNCVLAQRIICCVDFEFIINNR